MVLSFQFECDRNLCLGKSSDNWKHENGYLVGQQFRTVECLWGNKTCHGEDFSNEQQEKQEFCSTYVDPDPDDSSNYFCSKFYYKDETLEKYKQRTFKCQAKHYSRRGSKKCKNILPEVVGKCDEQKLWSKSTKSHLIDNIAYRFCNDSEYGLISEKTV